MSERMQDVVWQTRQIAPLGMTLDFFSGAPISEGLFEETNYVVQSAAPLILGVWFGPNQNLETFRAGLGGRVTFAPEEEARICELPARRQVATVEASSAVGLIAEPDGSLGHIYSFSEGTTEVAVAFRIAAETILIKWQVPTAKREAYLAVEQHFFSAIVCK